MLIETFKAVFKTDPAKGFIRYSDGTVAYFGAPNAAATYFTDRNVHFISIGNYSTNNDPTLRKGFLLNGKVFTPIVEPKAVIGTSVQGINRWNTIVGWYLDGAENSHGFKRSSNGSFVTLDYPGASTTTATGINDNGMIVGTWANPRGNIGGGFVLYNGKWVSVEYPGKVSETTDLFGISNAGVMIGINTQDEPYTSFLYENGLFKVISVPNSQLNNQVDVLRAGHPLSFERCERSMPRVWEGESRYERRPNGKSQTVGVSVLSKDKISSWASKSFPADTRACERANAANVLKCSPIFLVVLCSTTTRWIGCMPFSSANWL
jgi:hypothetical protein